MLEEEKEVKGKRADSIELLAHEIIRRSLR